MAKDKALPPVLAALVEEFTVKASRLLYGPEGVPADGTRFDEIEEDGVHVGDQVARALMEQAAQADARRTKATTCSCGRPLGQRPLEPRLLTTRRGDVGWNEPVGYCPACRRDFFPSEPETGSLPR
jgi:hypothetical protein